MSQLFASGGQSVGASASRAVRPMYIQGWFLLGLTALISLLTRDSQEYSLALQVESVRTSALSLLYGTTLTSIYDYWKKPTTLTIWNFVGKVMPLLFNMLSMFVIALLPRNRCLLISWLQSPSSVILEPKNIKSVTASTFSPSTCHEVMGPGF